MNLQDSTRFGAVVIASEEGEIKRITAAVWPPGS
jgi:hypothetical protein